MNAFTTAIAVNLGILPLSLLQAIPGKDVSISYAGYFIEFSQYFDPRTPTMEAIICLRNITGGTATASTSSTSAFLSSFNNRFCMMQFSSSIMIPIFNHVGAGIGEPKQCLCSNGVGSTTACQQFNLMPSLLFYNIPGNTSISTVAEAEAVESYQLTRLLLLVNSTTYTTLTNDAYNVSYATIGTIYPGIFCYCIINRF
jgi:hypothetical protein